MAHSPCLSLQLISGGYHRTTVIAQLMMWNLKAVSFGFLVILGTCDSITTKQAFLQQLGDIEVDISDIGDIHTAWVNNTSSGGCYFACNALALGFGADKVAESNDQGAYGNKLSEFWSAQQSNTTPACLFLPVQSKEVSAAILLSRLTQCPFAVKSGGHAAFKGASNVENGLTIDLARLNQVNLSQSGDIVSIGTGNTWNDVYTALEPYNRIAVGGRVASVGVGGLTLGGGLSFFSNKYGFACDNIANYEVVTASGEILNANETSHPNLYWALRGGGNNFGVVTRLDAYAYPQGQMWGGNLVFSISANTSLIQNLVTFGRGRNGTFEDPNAAVILAFAYDTTSGSWLAVTSLENAVAQPNGSHPAVFDGFFDIPDILADSTENNSLSNITLDLDVVSPYGYRDTYWQITLLLDERIMSAVLEIWYEETEVLVSLLGSETQVPSFDFQVITEPQLEHMHRAGGNALGLDYSGPLVSAHWTYMWDDASKDSAIFRAYQRVLVRAKAAGELLGLNHRYIYMNYASQFQDPISGYGPESKARLLEVSKTYDPEGVFQDLQPGYFKLDKGPPEVAP
ncbi:hypothetical protein VPNG_04282 [Cytospora leucostoma]|uniref:FAD-binding PCMH-type domain-containing protein n=1 Tax=Cytospora leucostoma TaxID=1230097 RepID=A0A423XDK5_9PEZI|nr:hypothetical protein VPNG_04282 [Cytospora leucostoma]